jgi:methylthioribose-1-phosphate isomerase
MTEALNSIRLSDDKIEIVNQLLLPHTTEWLAIDTIEQAHDAIKTMKVSTSRTGLGIHTAAQS